jgi:DNA replication and repair protein RecF
VAACGATAKWLRRAEDFVGGLLVTVFSPDDIGIVKGGPERRREMLDTVATSLSPGHELNLSLLERAVRQRNALLRAAGGSLRRAMENVLDVWDSKLAEAGEAVVAAREKLVGLLEPEVVSAYSALGGSAPVELRYQRSWDGGLLEALKASRALDLSRGATATGPQRDDLLIGLSGLLARSQASQGQQRGLALALRLGAHALVARYHATSPVLLLDDVFSELDPARSAALAACLPEGQAFLTVAGQWPRQLPVAATVAVRDGSFGSPESPALGQLA